ncbi:hypothetical protein C8Q74DRAFT_88150 [Fomes fomentarius]|nr:hypothetical protein C8Q74DRAFT_88150 [Fomes fomentarius]
MAKKGAAAPSRIGPGQPSSVVPPHMRSHLSRAPATSRKSTVTFRKPDPEEDRMDVDEDEVGEEEEEEDDNMAEMLNILQELQKRKVTKTSTRSVAFHREKAALFNAARKKAEGAVRHGIASVEKARATIVDLKGQETSQEVTFGKLQSLWKEQDECVQRVSGHLTSVIEDLSHRRAAQINESSAMLEAQPSVRDASRRKLFTFANARISENMENQKIAADATALIKHYKALILS